MFRGKATLFWLLTVAALSGCAESSASRSAGRGGPVVVDADRCEVRLTAVVQKTDAPRMADWGSATPALLGSRGGKYEEYFVFLVDAGVKDVYDALGRLGARSTRVYALAEVDRHKGLRPDNTPADYLAGDPVQIFVEWEHDGQTRRLAYEDFFLERVDVGGGYTTKPWTPHFVFHGSGVVNKKKTGCIACTHDCPGGIIGNNQYPLVEPVPTLRADWQKLPPPGTAVTVVIRPVPSADTTDTAVHANRERSN